MTDESTGLTGYLESPEAWYPRSAALAVAGWVFSSNAAIRAVEVVVDDASAVVIAHGFARPDVSQRYGPTAERSGFVGVVPITRLGDRPTIRVSCLVLLEDGRRLPWLQRVVRVQDSGVMAGLLRVTAVIADALRAAVRQRRLPP